MNKSLTLASAALILLLTASASSKTFVREFRGDKNATTAEFRVDGPWLLDWRLDADYEHRSKAYLDVNCAHCHNSVGAADTSGLDLELNTPVDRDYGVCKPPVAAGRGSGDRPYDIYPGRPEDSIMIYRMQHTDPAIAMPELGRSTVHDRGLALVTEWVASLQGEC